MHTVILIIVIGLTVTFIELFKRWRFQSQPQRRQKDLPE